MRTNEISKSKKIAILMAVAIMSVICCVVVSAQCPCAVPIPNEARLPAGFYPADSPEAKIIERLGIPPIPPKSFLRASAAPAFELQSVLVGLYGETIEDYNNNRLFYSSQNDENPMKLLISIIVNGSPTKVKYSLYTFTPEARKGSYLQYITGCSTNGNFSNWMKDQNNPLLIKIHDFNDGNPVDEGASGYRIFNWNGLTDKGEHIRDCLYIVATDEAGNILGTIDSGGGVELYRISTTPGVEFTKDDNNVLHAKITLAYDRPVTKIGMFIATENCLWDATPLSMINQDNVVAAMAAQVNRDSNGGGPNPHNVVIAYKEFKPEEGAPGPDDPTGGAIKTFKWDNIMTVDNKPFTYPVPPNPDQEGASKYMVAILLGTDIITVNGIKDGSLYYGSYHDMNNLDNYTDIQSLAISGKKIIIETTPNGFIINPKGNYDGEWVLMSVAGEKVSSGKGSFVSKSGLPKGVYLLTVANKQGGKETQKVIVR